MNKRYAYAIPDLDICPKVALLRFMRGNKNIFPNSLCSGREFMPSQYQPMGIQIFCFLMHVNTMPQETKSQCRYTYVCVCV